MKSPLLSAICSVFIAVNLLLQIYFYLLSNVSLLVLIGLNSRTIIVIASRVWAPTLLRFLNGKFCLGFGSRVLVVFQLFVVRFEFLVKLFQLAF